MYDSEGAVVRSLFWEEATGLEICIELLQLDTVESTSEVLCHISTFSGHMWQTIIAGRWLVSV